MSRRIYNILFSSRGFVYAPRVYLSFVSRIRPLYFVDVAVITRMIHRGESRAKFTYIHLYGRSLLFSRLVCDKERAAAERASAYPIYLSAVIDLHRAIKFLKMQRDAVNLFDRPRRARGGGGFYFVPTPLCARSSGVTTIREMAEDIE